ncbi:glycosyltransferase family 39 protein [Thermococcus sp.]|uniref:glycosyltransferase family 39 protein n=1 Tax=Thermococcus sp. TaxID=35749 RepID=UPI0026393057|nr:glycosyltransferase family 39 protein [Thermococcus sp.]
MGDGRLSKTLLSLSDRILRPRYAVIILTILAASIRLLPMRFKYLLGYDPYFHLAYTRYALTHGWINFFPYALGPWGFQIKLFHPLGLWMTPAYVYKLLHPLGVSLFNAFRLTPVIFGVLTVILVYLTVLRTYGRREAFLAAFLLAVSFGHVFRSMAGYYRGDNYMLFWYTVGLAAIAFALTCRCNRYLRLAIYIIPGLSAGFASAFWQAYYPIFAFFLANSLLLTLGAFLLEKDEKILDGLAISLSLVPGVFLANWIGGRLGYGMTGETRGLGRNLAKELGVHFGVLKDVFLIVFLKYALTLSILAILALILIARFVKDRRIRWVVASVGVIVALVLTFRYYGIVNDALNTLFPVAPIGETQRTNWTNWWEAYGVSGVLFLLFALRFRRPSTSDFLILGTALVLIPMALVWTRFLFIGSLAVALLAGIGLVDTFDFSAGKVNVAWKRAAIAVLLLLLLPSVSAYQGFSSTLAVHPFVDDHWADALTYLGEHSNINDVVLTWWDHGHWVTYFSNRAPVAQGGPNRWVARYYLGLIPSKNLMNLGVDYVIVSYDTLTEFEAVLKTAGMNGRDYALVILPLRSAYGDIFVFSSGPYSLMAAPGKTWDVKVSLRGQVVIPAVVFVESGKTLTRVVLSSPPTAPVYAYINLNYGYAVIMNRNAFDTALAKLMFTNEYPPYYHLIYSDGGLIKIFRFEHPNVAVTAENGSVVLKFTNATGTGVGIYGFLDNGTLVYRKWFNVKGKDEFILPENLNGSVVVRYIYSEGKTVLDRGVFRIGDVLDHSRR